jgi:hypothetical protein
MYMKAGKTLLIFLLLIIILGVSYFYFSLSDPTRNEERAYEEIQELYTENVKGGTTPQETLDLFVAALEKGDIDDAVLYIDPEVRDSYKDDLQAGYENGNLEKYTEVIKGVDGGFEMGQGRFEFQATETQSGTVISYNLVFNELAEVWMFESI